MADAEAETDERTIKLQVAAARQEESGHGIARLPKESLSRLGAMEGDVLEIIGKDTTVARAMLAYRADAGRWGRHTPIPRTKAFK